MKSWFKKLWLCRIWSWHDWTCAAIEGVPPTPEQLKNGVAGFFDYARTYCRRCDKESLSSAEARAKANGEAGHG